MPKAGGDKSNRRLAQSSLVEPPRATGWVPASRLVPSGDQHCAPRRQRYARGLALRGHAVDSSARGHRCGAPQRRPTPPRLRHPVLARHADDAAGVDQIVGRWVMPRLVAGGRRRPGWRADCWPRRPPGTAPPRAAMLRASSTAPSRTGRTRRREVAVWRQCRPRWRRSGGQPRQRGRRRRRRHGGAAPPAA